jgi:hypothetical protein
MLKKQGSDASYPCLKMRGAGSATCYPCRMRKRPCNVDSNGPIEWIPVKKHHVDTNESTQRNQSRGKWMRRKDLQHTSQTSSCPSADQQLPHDTQVLSGDSFNWNSAATAANATFPPRISLILDPEIHIPGLSQAMQTAMQVFTFHWRETGHLPSLAWLDESASHNRKSSPPDSSSRPFLATRKTSYFDSTSHAMDFAGRVWARTPNTGEMAMEMLREGDDRSEH